MPRDGSGIYTKFAPNVVSGTTIESAPYNGTISDIETDLNAARPIIAGGTGASNADQALVNMSGEKAAQLVASYDSHLWVPGSFRSAAAASGAPNATSSFVGTAYINEALANPPTNANVVIEARDQNDTTIPGRTYVREKKAGTWGAWTGGIFAAPFDAMAYNGMQVNGGAEVSQELGTSTIFVSGTGKHIMDSWVLGSIGAGNIGSSQTTTAPPGFPNAILASAAAGATPTPAATDRCSLDTRIEGYRVARLAWGTGNAQPITIAFWVLAVRPGNYSGVVTNGTQTRNYPFSFTINATGTWEYKTVTVPGDTTGTWAKDNTKGMGIIFTLMAGTSLQAAANAWTGTANIMGVTGTVNGIANTSDQFFITGVTVFPGTQAPTAAYSPNIMRPYGEELVTCKRYFQIVGPGLSGVAGGADTVRVIGSWLPLRTSPTASLSGAVNIDDDYTANFTQSVAAIALDHVSPDNQYGGGRVSLANFAGLVTGRMYSVTQIGGQVKLDARL